MEKDCGFYGKTQIEHNLQPVGPALFPKEYLAISDSWLNDTFEQGTFSRQAFRQGLLDSQMDAEGYMLSQQHAACSHDLGWPFPHWVQAPDPKGSKGRTAGWHFYEKPQGWELLFEPVKAAFPERVGAAATETWTTEGLESKGDIALGISTSGNAENVYEALKSAKDMGLKIITMTGKGGGKISGLADIALLAPSDNTPRVQELHMTAGHIICELVEDGLCKK